MTATLMVDVRQVKPNKWNYNTQTPAVFQKVVESIRRYGFSDPVVVRELGTTPHALYEVINGEHRWRAAIELGMKEIPVFNLGKVEDVRAKQLCITLNELGGTSDEVRLAELLREITLDQPVASIEQVMPFSSNEMKQLLDSVDFSFSKASKEDTRDKTTEVKKTRPPKAPTGPQVTRLRVLIAPSRLAAVHAEAAKAVVTLLDWWEETHREPDPESVQ